MTRTAGWAIAIPVGAIGVLITERAAIRDFSTGPILIERPIVIRDGAAVIARPPERLLALLD